MLSPRIYAPFDGKLDAFQDEEKPPRAMQTEELAALSHELKRIAQVIEQGRGREGFETWRS